MEAETGTILYAKNIHAPQYPASCTKILTCLIAAEQCAMDETVVMSSSAIQDTPRDSNHIALDIGEELTLEQCLYAILIRSANEVSFAVGEHVSGTTWQDFAELMNRRAAELGCQDSHFVNPNGLPDEAHYTSAYDLATIGRAFFANEMLAKISRTPTLDLQPTDKQPDHILEHTSNKLLPGQSQAYEYLVGSKTGYTDAARSCLVSCAEKNGMRLICVVLKDESGYQFDDTVQLFEYGFSNFNKFNVAQYETRYNIDNTDFFYNDNDIFGSSRPLLAISSDDFIILPRSADFKDAVSAISYDTSNNERAALITYTYQGVTVGSASLDFTADEEDTYTFDEDIQTSREPADSPEDMPVIFVNVLKILLWAALALAVILLTVLLVRFVRRHPASASTRRRRQTRRRQKRNNRSQAVNARREKRLERRARKARVRRAKSLPRYRQDRWGGL